MKTILLSIVLTVLLIGNAQSQNVLNDIKNQVNNAVQGGGGSQLSNQDVVNGLKEALTIGTNNSTTATSKMDGFNKNPKIRLPFPQEAVKMKNTLEGLGMKPQVDKFVVSLNRAAEEAAKEAAPIFINAIKAMTIQDGFTILKGSENAATQYLNDKTTADLTAKFRPVVKAAIQKAEVAKYWKPLMTRYNKVPGVQRVNPDLEAYVTQKAIEGLFLMIAEEEMKIRKDPASRVTDLLKKVFG
jgi:hypothetical protein